MEVAREKIGPLFNPYLRVTPLHSRTPTAPVEAGWHTFQQGGGKGAVAKPLTNSNLH